MRVRTSVIGVIALSALCGSLLDARARRDQDYAGAKPAAGEVKADALKFNGVLLRVSDIKRSIAFYKDELNLRLTFANESVASFDAGGIPILLDKVENLDPKATGSTAMEVIFEVADVKATDARLRARGIPFLNKLWIVASDATRNRWASAFKDPDGHVLSISGWMKKEY